MKKRRIKYFLVAIVIAWLFGANIIVGKIYNNSYEIDIKEISVVKQEQLFSLEYAVDKFTVEHNLFDLVNISGWALCPTSSGEAKQLTSILLISDSRIYEIKTEQQQRGDVKNLMLERGGFQVSGNHGFFVTFCPYVIRDGVYQVVFACKEDEMVVGSNTSEYLFVKKRGEIKIEERLSRRLEAVEIQNQLSGNIEKCIDYIGKQKDFLLIKGWMIMDEGVGENHEKIVELILDNKTRIIYEADTYSRPDLLQITSLENSLRAGIIVKIPYQDIENYKNVKINFYIREQGNVYLDEESECYNIDEIS